MEPDLKKTKSCVEEQPVDDVVLSQAQVFFDAGLYPELTNMIIGWLPGLHMTCLYNRLMNGPSDDPLAKTLLPHLDRLVVRERACLQSRKNFVYGTERNKKVCAQVQFQEMVGNPVSICCLTVPSAPLMTVVDRNSRVVVKGVRQQYIFSRSYKGCHNECMIILDYIDKDGIKYPTRLQLFRTDGSLRMEATRQHDDKLSYNLVITHINEAITIKRQWVIKTPSKYDDQLVCIEFKHKPRDPQKTAHTPHQLNPDEGVAVAMGLEEITFCNVKNDSTLQRWCEYHRGHRFVLDKHLYFRRRGPFEGQTQYYPIRATDPFEVLSEFSKIIRMPTQDLCRTRQEAIDLLDKDALYEDGFLFDDRHKRHPGDSDDNDNDPNFLK